MKSDNKLGMEGLLPAKKRKIESKIDSEKVIYSISTSLDNEICFDVISSTDKNKKYIVKIFNNNGINMECNCGDQWGIKPRRNNCKHIGGIIGNIVKEYVLNNTKKEGGDMDDIIEKFKGLMK